MPSGLHHLINAVHIYRDRVLPFTSGHNMLPRSVCVKFVSPNTDIPAAHASYVFNFTETQMTVHCILTWHYAGHHIRI